MFAKIFRVLKILINYKFIFLLPQKKSVLIFDFQSREAANKIFSDKELEFLSTRNEEINFFIYLRCVLRGHFNKINYFVEYINHVNPKIVITFIDNNLMFQKLRNHLKIPTFSVQAGNRTYLGDTFAEVEKMGIPLRDNLRVDNMFVFDQFTGEKYKSFFKGNYFVIGSVLSNSKPIFKTNIKKNLIFISNFRLIHLKKNEFIYKKITYEEFIKSESQLIEFLQSYCIKNKLNFCVLGKYKNSVKKIETEYEYFENFIKRGNWEFIENQTNRETYKIIDSAKLVTGINSTLLFESLGRGNKTIFFNVRPNFFPFNSQSFGYLSNKPDQGPFWYNGTNKKIFQKIADDVINLGEIEWKKIIDHYSKDIMKYDYNNSILKKKLNQFGVDTLN